MSNEQALDLRKLVALIWGKLMIEKRYPDAILACMLGYVLSRSKPEEGFEDEALSLLFKTVEEFQNEHRVAKSSLQTPTPACSFCRRKEPEVRLAAGAGGFICSDCAQTAIDVLNRPANLETAD
jgi:hypothetical protein